MKKVPIRLVLAVAWVLWIGWAGAAWTGASAAAQGSDPLWEGSASNQKEALIDVVETQEEWSDLWRRAFDQPAPAVDFEKHVVGAVFLGHGADWLYSIHIGEPYLRDAAWRIPYEKVELILELAKPFRGAGQYCMKRVERKTDAPMVIEEAGPDTGPR